jgi:rhodanese-related sulfurtransferase
MPEKQLCRELSPQMCYRLLTKEKETPCAILDVRTSEEFREGHLKGADNIDFYLPDFRECIEKKDRSSRYLVYCRKGVRGHKTMELMRQCGFLDVTNISGGFENWSLQGLPVEKH